MDLTLLLVIFGPGLHFFFSCSYLSQDGTTRDESGIGGVRQTGGWEYVGPDGKIYSIRFVADENGFQPIGDHLVILLGT